MKKYKIHIVLLLLLALAACSVVQHRISKCGNNPPVSSSRPFSAGSVSESAPSYFYASSEAVSSSRREESEAPSAQVSGRNSGLVTLLENSVVSGYRASRASGTSRTPAVSAVAASASVSAPMPAASGTDVFLRQGCTLDYSNASQGYVMAKYSGSAKIKVLVYYNGSSSYYQYMLDGSGNYATLPLQSGSGSYRIRFMENLYGNSYAELCSTVISASVSGQGCNLYPNQYVNYTRSSAAVRKAQSLCAGASSDAQRVSAIYRFITATVKYDYAKADNVTSGYIPNVDSTLSSHKGICFDYAALMAAMCRSQRIPARLVIGHTSCGYHAWNEVYLGGWKRYDSTFAAAGQTAGVYTAEKYY